MGGRKYGKKKKPATTHQHAFADPPPDHLDGPLRFASKVPKNPNSFGNILSVSKILGCNQVNAQLPKSIWMLHSGDTHITNDRSLLVGARDCDESLYDKFGNRLQAQAIGEVYLELYNNLTLRLKRVRYAPDVKYNLLSDIVLQDELNFTIEFDKLKTHLCFMEQSGAETRFEAMNTVAGKFVFLTKQPAIDYVIEYAEAHPTPNIVDCLSTFTQDSTVGKYYREVEHIKQRIAAMHPN